MARPLVVVVMGVSGSGKTTVGEALAAHLSVPYADGDDFHSEANVAKMARGEALTDVDRAPWLAAIAAWMRAHGEHGGSGAVVSCSALRRAYRDVLSAAAPAAIYLHLTGSEDLLRERVSGRRGHFMPASLLRSQLDALEPLAPDERGVALDVARTPDALVAAFVDFARALA
ncbi:MAG: gluconokinase [Polyangiales bacterium]